MRETHDDVVGSRAGASRGRPVGADRTVDYEGGRQRSGEGYRSAESRGRVTPRRPPLPRRGRHLAPPQESSGRVNHHGVARRADGGPESWAEEPWARESWAQEPWAEEPWAAEPWAEESSIRRGRPDGGQVRSDDVHRDRPDVERAGEPPVDGDPSDAPDQPTGLAAWLPTISTGGVMLSVAVLVLLGLLASRVIGGGQDSESTAPAPPSYNTPAMPSPTVSTPTVSTPTMPAAEPGPVAPVPAAVTGGPAADVAAGTAQYCTGLSIDNGSAGGVDVVVVGGRCG